MRPSDRSMRLGCSAKQPRQDRVNGAGWPLRSAHAEAGSGAGKLARLRRAGRRLGQQPAQPRNRGAQIAAVHHHVDHAVIAQIFRSLKSFGQLFPNGLLDDTGTGEADQRAGLSNMHVAKHGIGRGNAAGGRIGQYDDVRFAAFAQPLHRNRRARHLHQRQMPSCMRAPPEAANKTNGQPFSTAVSRPLIIASPAAMPSEPPMKSKSCTPMTVASPSSLP